MSSEETRLSPEAIEGRLAALEVAARIAIAGYGRRMWASAYPNHLPHFAAAIRTAAAAGGLPGPTDPAGRAEMDEALARIFSPPYLGEPQGGDRTPSTS